jgi:hypothetical protein
MAVLEQYSTLNPATRSKCEERLHEMASTYFPHSYCSELWTVSGALPPSALVQTRTGIPEEYGASTLKVLFYSAVKTEGEYHLEM